MFADLYQARPTAPSAIAREVPMNRSTFIRRTHRCVAMAFILLVLANIIACSFGPPPAWLTYAPLLPLLLLMIGGIIMFFQPYAARRRLRRPALVQEVLIMSNQSPSEMIDARIAGLTDWRGATLARLRALIHEADPEVEESVKWAKAANPLGVPVWEHRGIICTGELYRDKVKLTFAQGASLDDPAGLFNSSLDGNTRRAIDIPEGATFDADAFRALVREAVALNMVKKQPGR